MRLIAALIRAMQRREALATMAHRSMIADATALRDRIAEGR